MPSELPSSPLRAGAPSRAAAIRSAGGSDVAAVVSLVEAAFRGEPSRAGWTTEADLLDGQRTDAQMVAELIADPTSELLLAELDGSLVGCCQLTRLGGDRAYLGMLAVDPRLQGAGIGGLLVAAAEQRAAALAVGTIEMTVIEQRCELIDWYRRRGYRLTGERRPFPYGDSRYGLPRREDLEFVVLNKSLA